MNANVIVNNGSEYEDESRVMIGEVINTRGLMYIWGVGHTKASQLMSEVKAICREAGRDWADCKGKISRVDYEWAILQCKN